jgi:hypothetical protein
MDILGLARRTRADFARRWLAALRDHDVNHYLPERPPGWRRAVTIAAVLGALYLLLVLHAFACWICTMPLAMFDRRRSAQGVLEASQQMLRGCLWRSIAPLIAWWAGLGAASTALAWLSRPLTERALAWAGVDVQRVLPLVAVTALAFGVAGVLYARLDLRKVRDLTLAGLATIDIGSRRAPRYSGERPGLALHVLFTEAPPELRDERAVPAL